MSDLLFKKRGYVGHIGDVEIRRANRNAYAAALFTLSGVIIGLVVVTALLAHKLEQKTLEAEAYRRAWDAAFTVAQTDPARPWPTRRP